MGNSTSAPTPTPSTPQAKQANPSTSSSPSVSSLENPVGNFEPRHNAGQPLHPELDRDGKQRTKFKTDCSKEHRNSLACIEDHYENKSVCQPFFDAYKACRRKENEERRARNAKRFFGAFCCIHPSRFLSRQVVSSTNGFHFDSQQADADTEICDESEGLTLGLLTFDLDDTLFPVKPVVQEANDAQMRALHAQGFSEATETSITRHSKSIRRKTKKSLTYSDLRKKSIAQEIEMLTNEAPSLDIVELVFQTWLQERHAAAERHLFPSAIEMLQEVRSNFPDVCIAAVTNGRGNPLDMNRTLAPYFDFCISGEDKHVFPERKPARGIYQATLSHYHHRCPQPQRRMRSSFYESPTGTIWIHVGDCLGNDVWGSARCGARTIWMEYEALQGDTTNDISTSSQPSYSTATASQIKSRQKLANKGRNEVDERITHLDQLSGAVERILKKEHLWRLEARLSQHKRKRGRGFAG